MRGWKTMLAAAGFAITAHGAAAKELYMVVGDAMVTMTNHFGAGKVAGAMRFLLDSPEGLTADTLGQFMVLRRHFDAAALFYSLAATMDSDAPSLNNLAVMLAQVALAEPDAWPEDMLDDALTIARAAVERAPGEAVMHNTRGSIAARLGFRDEAKVAHARATELDPDEPLYWANLARDFEALGDTDGAAAALARAHALAPADPVVRFLRRDLPPRPAYEDAVLANCDVNFRCDDICPKSIIGTLLNVQCEMDNMSAKVACFEGRPYARSYECNEQFPEYGILIPGLNAGFTVFTRNFKMHVLFNGDQIDIRWELNTSFGSSSLLGMHAGMDGHYPRGGDLVLDNFRTGIDLELLPGDLGKLDQLDDLDIPLAEIMMRADEDAALEIPVSEFNDALVTF